MKVKDLNKLLANGRFATVMFVKRTTGEVRRMRCRKGVRRHLRGGSPAYDFDDKGLVSVFDLDRRAYRSIPAERVTEVRAGGRVHRFEPDAPEIRPAPPQ